MSGLDFEAALHWWLKFNHYPPVHDDFFPSVREAITCLKAGDLEHKITLPNGNEVTVAESAEQLHLHEFLGDEVEWDDY